MFIFYQLKFYYHYGETNLLLWSEKFLSDPFTKVKNIQQVVEHRYYDVDYFI